MLQQAANLNRIGRLSNTFLEAGLQLEPGEQFKVYKSGCKPVWYGKGVIGKIFYDLVRNNIGSVDEVEHFKTCPNIFEGSKRCVATTLRFC